MAARGSAGAMFRFVLHAVTVLRGRDTLSLSLRNLSMHTHCAPLVGRAVGMPLVSVSRYHGCDKHATRAIMSQSSNCKQQRWLCYGTHPCFRALTTLTPRIRRPKKKAVTTNSNDEMQLADLELAHEQEDEGEHDEEGHANTSSHPLPRPRRAVPPGPKWLTYISCVPPDPSFQSP
jgi:hypothetical protein